MMTYRQWKDATVREIAAEYGVSLSEARHPGGRDFVREYLRYVAASNEDITPAVARSVYELVGDISEFCRWANLNWVNPRMTEGAWQKVRRMEGLI